MTATGITLVLGGARSGKSAFAERLVSEAGGRAVYIATAEARDGEMRDRIDVHRARRGGDWTTIEAPLDLVGALRDVDAPDTAILVDCLTLWLANLLGARRDIAAETDALVAGLAGCRGPVVLVSNEVGMGIVPENEMARTFRDLQGTLNQTVAAAADRVWFVAAGLPLALKGGAE